MRRIKGGRELYVALVVRYLIVAMLSFNVFITRANSQAGKDSRLINCYYFHDNSNDVPSFGG